MTKFAWMCATEAYQPEVLLEQALLAEEAGFDAVVVSDAFQPWTDEGAAGFTWSWLGAAVARTRRIEFITTVTSPLFRYHPAVIAQAAATLDRLSGGRFILGVGTGDPIHDAPLGWPDVGYRERGARLTEAVQIIRSLWTGERVSYEGSHYPIKGARLYSPPVSSMRLWMAAGGPRSASVAGRIADGVITSVKDPAISKTTVIEPFLESAASRSRSVLATRWVVFGEDEDEAWRALGPMRGLRVPDRGGITDPRTLREWADGMSHAELLASFPVARDCDGIVSAYRPLVDELGADYVSIQIACCDPDVVIRRTGEEVLPMLRIAGQQWTNGATD
jgi:coenzyme F420-dependent glucose-6-phosphate dehydrogenase